VDGVREELLQILAAEGFAGRLFVYLGQLLEIDDGVPSPKHGQNILYTSAEIIDCIAQRGGGLYAVCTSSKSHNCCTGVDSCTKGSGHFRVKIYAKPLPTIFQLCPA
jgi:hypothetical protein